MGITEPQSARQGRRRAVGRAAQTLVAVVHTGQAFSIEATSERSDWVAETSASARWRRLAQRRAVDGGVL